MSLRHPILIASFAFALQLALHLSGAPRQSAPTDQALHNALVKLTPSGKEIGITAAIARRDGTVVTAASGLADRESKVPMQARDRMLAGSVGKMFAATVILLAIQDGSLALDDRAEKWLGGESWYARVPNAHDLTLSMLMHHSSGIPEHVLDPKFTAALQADREKDWTPAELVSFILDKPALFPAGTGWSYADTNYILAAMAFEKATGRSYYSDLQRRVLKPLGLKLTSPSDRRVLVGLIPGYVGPRSPFHIEGRTLDDHGSIINPQMEWTGGGVISNPADLARFAKLLYEGKVLSRASTNAMLTGVDASSGRGGSKDEKYGLAVQMRPSKWGMTWGHDGWFPGYLTEVVYYPEHKTAIAIQLNSDDQRAMGTSLGKLIEGISASIFDSPN